MSKQRVGFRMRLFKGLEGEYKRRHDELWPELATLLRQAGISDYSIFLDEQDNTLFGMFTTEDMATLKQLREAPVMKKWWAYMADIMETNPDHSPVEVPLKEVFYLP